MEQPREVCIRLDPNIARQMEEHERQQAAVIAAQPPPPPPRPVMPRKLLVVEAPPTPKFVWVQLLPLRPPAQSAVSLRLHFCHQAAAEALWMLC